jgi:Protein of unknown function (DUF3108)
MVGCLLALALAAQTQPQFLPEGQTLNYSVKGPDSAKLGEAQLQASRSAGGRWSFAFSLDASVPGFTVSDSYQSLADADLFTIEFVKQFTHGARKGAERITFDPASRMATRETLGGGGKSQFSGLNARDPLAFLFYLRRELAAGRRPAARGTTRFGALYEIALEYGATEKIPVDGRPTDADLVTVSVQGPVARSTIRIWFLRDAARTPVRIAVPLAAGTFSLDLVR